MVSLVKGQSVSLSKMSESQLDSVIFGLGWSAIRRRTGFLAGLLGGGGTDIDLDASCMMFDAGGELVDSVWFRQLKSQCGAMTHTGDNRQGSSGGDNDDEQIHAQLSKLPKEVTALVLTVNSFTGQNFNEVQNSFCRVVDKKTGKELAKYALTEQGHHTGLIVASLSRDASGEWTFKAIGEPVNGRTVKDMAPLAQMLLKR